MSRLALSPDELRERPTPQLMCVPLVVFQLHPATGVDLYVWPDADDEPMLYCAADVEFTERDLERLLERGCRSLYISNAAYSDFTDELKDRLGDILADGSTPVEQRMAVLQSAMSLEIETAFHTIDSERFVSLSRHVARQIGTLLNENQVMPCKLVQMLRHDFYTFTHITNVATYASLLAAELGLTADEQRLVTEGGLLHDVGKRFIPSSVLCKRTKLTDAEWDLIRAHPQRGYEDLCDRVDLTRAQLLMVYSHHERMDGKGYPVGLVGEDIHPWARLLSVVDVFDALTGARPYRSSWKVQDALAYLERNAGTQFDGDMVQCWLSAMKWS